MIAATKGEYKGTGKLVGDHPQNSGGLWPILLFFVFLIIVSAMSKGRRGYGYGRRGYGNVWFGGFGGGGGGGGWSGGGFSGGGGSFGGGGAGGRW